MLVGRPTIRRFGLSVEDMPSMNLQQPPKWRMPGDMSGHEGEEAAEEGGEETSILAMIRPVIGFPLLRRYIYVH